MNIRAVSMLAWMAACGLGAMTGVLFASSVYLSPYMMGLVILKAFAAIIVGGMGSVLGVFVGGLCLGLLESLVAYLLSPLVQDTVPLVVIVLVLMLRPEGLFSRMPAWRA